MFSLGNSDEFKNYTRIDGIITYNNSVPSWTLENRDYRNVHVIYPIVKEVNVPRDRQKVICATTELYPYNRPHLAVDIAKVLSEMGIYIKYYYRPDWLEDAKETEQDLDSRAYLKQMDYLFGLDNPGFIPTPFNTYDVFQEELASAGAYLVVRDGAVIALTEAEAMFNGTCVVRYEEIPYIGYSGITNNFDTPGVCALWIAQLLKNDELYNAYSKRGRELTGVRTIDGMANKLMEIL